MADVACAHPRLDFLDPDRRRGWVCPECAASGPTTVKVEVGPDGRAALVCACVCSSATVWPYTATGEEVAAFLSEHADCDTERPEDAPRWTLPVPPFDLSGVRVDLPPPRFGDRIVRRAPGSEDG